MKDVYFFSGLGADERVFANLHLPAFNIHYIKWVAVGKGEAIEHYARRITTQINTSNPVLVGLSFGGIMAIEVAKQIETEKVIVISSIKTRSELPNYLKLVAMLRLHRLLPGWFLKNTNLFVYWFFDVSSQANQKLLKAILQDSDINFTRWAIEKILFWKNNVVLKNIIHIHGTNDRILPMAYANADVHIDGGHLMILDKTREIETYLEKLITS